MAPLLALVTIVAAQSFLHNVAYAQSIPDTGALVSSIQGQVSEAVTITAVATSTAVSGACPAIWHTIASGLSADMRGCNDIARSAI